MNPPIFLGYAALLQASMLLPMPHGIRWSMFGMVTGITAFSAGEWLTMRLVAIFAEQLGLLFPT